LQFEHNPETEQLGSSPPLSRGGYLPILIITADASRIAKQKAPDETTCERFDSSRFRREPLQ
jgi:hypothetical protein